MIYIYRFVFEKLKMGDWQVSVPCGSMLTIVTVRCGHCANLLSVNMAAASLQAFPPQLPQVFQFVSSDFWTIFNFQHSFNIFFYFYLSLLIASLIYDIYHTSLFYSYFWRVLIGFGVCENHFSWISHRLGVVDSLFLTLWTQLDDFSFSSVFFYCKLYFFLNRN